MKIAIPVDNKSLCAGVCASFGRSPYFLIYDTESNEAEFIENTAAKTTGGAGIKAAQIIADNKAGVLLTPRLGENAAGVVKSADIEIYKSVDGSVQDNINAYTNGKLSLLSEIHAGLHGGGR